MFRKVKALIEWSVLQMLKSVFLSVKYELLLFMKCFCALLYKSMDLRRKLLILTLVGIRVCGELTDELVQR